MAHQAVANGILTGLRDRAQERGVDLDIGELPELSSAPDADDPEQLAKVIAHVIARLGDRFAFIRKLSRQMEGTEKRAGLASDVLAALWILIKRNPETLETLGKQCIATVTAKQQQRAQRQHRKPSSSSPSQSHPINGGIS